MDMLFSIAEIKADFSNYEPLLLEEKEIILEEGTYHIGKGAVIRFVGVKNKRSGIMSTALLQDKFCILGEAVTILERRFIL
ncbi:hypothetical protein D3C86_1744990 [compost metagenome]